MKLWHKGFVVVAVPLVCELIFAATIWSIMLQTESSLREQSASQEIIASVASVSDELRQASAALAIYTSTRDVLIKEQSEKLLANIPRHLSAIKEMTEKQSSSSPDPSFLQQRLAIGIKMVNRLIEYIDQDSATTLALMTPHEFREILAIEEELDAGLREFSSAQSLWQRKQYEAQAQLQNALRNIIVFGALFNVIVTVIVATYFKRDIDKRVSRIIENAYLFASGKPLNLRLTGNDEIAEIDTVFHKMTSELATAARKERAMIDNAVDVICAIDENRTFSQISPSAVALLQYEPAELLGKRFIDLVAEDTAMITSDSINHAMATGSIVRFENRVRKKDGSLTDTLWSIIWSSTDSKLFCVLHDITVRKQAERLKQDVLEMVSHDLKTPLSNVQLSLEMLRSGTYGTFDDAAIDLLDRAEYNSGRMLILIKDLLDLEKLEAGMLSLNCEAVILEEIFETAAHSMSLPSAQMGVKIAFTKSDLTALADPDRVLQILINLLSNAMKFSPKGSTVKLEAERSEGDIAIRVIDSGRGVPDELKQAIFDRFAQASRSDARIGGTGLGLAICKALVELHGKTIQVTDNTSGGSIFTFCLPSAQAATREETNAPH